MTAGEVRIPVRLTPRGGADRIEGVEAGVLRVRVAAAPAEGAANAALLRLLADDLGVPRIRLRLVAGAASRTKLVAVDGVSRARVAARWPGIGGLPT
jgi:uncharacterized protein